MNKALVILGFTNWIWTFCYSQSMGYNSDYYNQITPNDIPVIFAKDIISKKGSYEYPCSFSSDMSEMYFGTNLFNEEKKERYILKVKRMDNGAWSHPLKISFTGFPESEPILTHDNSKLFFNVHNDSTKWKPHDIWYVERILNDWGPPTKLNSVINSNDYEYYTTMTKSNKIYFTREGKGIYSADFENNDFYNIKPIDPTINKMKWVGHPYISPDGSFLIFDSSEPGGYGSADLYISFKMGDKWRKPVNLGDKINTTKWDAMPIVSPDGKYLFFCREANNERDIYWVRFDLEKYKEKDNQ